MKPLPQTNHPVDKLISRRWSPRTFSGRLVEKEKINSLFEAARWAPSANNEQPWYFIYGTGENYDTFTGLLDCLVESNRVWASNAPLILMSIVRTYNNRNRQLNRFAFFDLGLAVENLVLQATSMDMFVHQMGGFSVEKAKTRFNLPDGFEPVSIIAIGYHGDINRLPEDFREREYLPQVRKEITEFVFTGSFEIT